MNETKKGVFAGLGLGLAFAVLVFSGVGFHIGSPLAFWSVESVGKLLVVVVLAGVLEELFFRWFLLWYLMRKTDLFKDFWRANIVQATLFSLFHVVVYGSLIGKNALFLSALVFGLVMGVVVRYYNRQTLPHNLFSQLPNIVCHMIINLSIIIPTLVIGLEAIG